MSKLETLLRQALAFRNEAAEALLGELRVAVREASEAVRSVTAGAADLDLVSLDPVPGKGDAYGLTLRWNHDDRVIRVFEFAASGAQIKLFGSLLGWQERNDARATMKDQESIRAVFADLVSSPDSDLVAMLRFIIGNTPKQPAATA